MKAHVQWLTKKIGILRVGKNFSDYGDQYDTSCVVVRKPGKSCSIMGLCGQYDKATRHAIKAALNENNIFTASWERIKPGKVLSQSGA